MTRPRAVGHSPLLQQVLAQQATRGPTDFRQQHPLAAALHGISQGLHMRALRKAEKEKQGLADQAGAKLARAMGIELPVPQSQDEFSYGDESARFGGRSEQIAAALAANAQQLSPQQFQIGSQLQQQRNTQEQQTEETRRQANRDERQTARDQAAFRQKKELITLEANLRAKKGLEDPASVREFKFYENLPTPEAKAEFLLLQRARQDPFSSHEQKVLSAAITGVIESESTVTELSALANEFGTRGSEELSAGAVASTEEWLKTALGSEDEVTVLRTRYRKLRNSKAVSDLPPGPASDRDIALALEGWPKPSANAEYMESFLIGLAKLQTLEMARARHRATYIEVNKSEVGMLADWEKNKDGLRIQELQRAGLDGDDDTATTTTTTPAPAAAPPTLADFTDEQIKNMTEDERMEILRQSGF